MADPVLTPEGLVDVVRDPAFQNLSPADREDIFNQGVSQARQWVSQQGGGWTPETWKGYNQAVDELRAEVTATSVGEKVMKGAKTVGRVLVDSVASMATAGVSVASGGGLGQDAVSQELVPNLAKVPSAVNRGLATLTLGSTGLVDPTLDALKQDIDEGRMPFGEDLKSWLNAKSDDLEQRQGDYFKLVEGDEASNRAWAKANSLTGNPQNLGLLTAYIQTRDPKLWDGLRTQLLTPISAHTAETQQQQRVKASTLGKLMDGLFGEGTSNYIVEAADPLEVAGTLLPILKGAKAVKAVAKGSRLAAAGDIVAGAVGETLSELGSQFIDDPTATFEQRKAVAMDAFIGSLGLMGLGAGVQKGADILTNRETPDLAKADEGLPDGTGVLANIAQSALAPKTPQAVPAFRDSPLEQPLEVGSGNLIADYGIAMSPQAQAIADEAQRKRQEQINKLRGLEQQAGSRMPTIPDSPLGGRDILDFVNDNPLYVPKRGSQEARNAENDWRENWDIPQYYRKFLASSERGHNAAELSQMAFDEGYISEPTPDALMNEIQNVMRARTQYRVEFRKREKALEQEAKQVTNFERSQAKPDDKTLLSFEDVQPGDELTIDGHDAKIRHVTFDEDGYMQQVVIEDGKAFGVLSLDAQSRGGIFVDEWKPRGEQVQDFSLESATPEQLAQEKAQAEQRAAIAAGQERQLKGDAGEFGTPDLLDTTAGDMALFNPAPPSRLQFSIDPKLAAERDYEQAFQDYEQTLTAVNTWLAAQNKPQLTLNEWLSLMAQNDVRLRPNDYTPAQAASERQARARDAAAQRGLLPTVNRFRQERGLPPRSEADFLAINLYLDATERLKSPVVNETEDAQDTEVIDFIKSILPGSKDRQAANAMTTQFWQTLASFDEAFQYGRTDSPDMAEIAKAVSLPNRPIKMERVGANQIRVTGTNGFLDIMAASSDRPYLSATEADSSGEVGGGGTQLYQAALDWIHNNGKRVRSDPRGITRINEIRRTSNMLSSALRWGTTKHLSPNVNQGVRWSLTDDMGNIARLAEMEMQHAMKAVAPARNWQYDFERDTFLDSTGAPAGNDALRSLVTDANPARSGIGLATLQRGILTASFYNAFKRGGAKATLSASELRGRTGSRLRRFLYSQPKPRQTGVAAEDAQVAVQQLNRLAPGLVNAQVNLFESPEDLLESGLLPMDQLTAEEWANIQQAEAFYDRASGQTVVLTNNIRPRAGESAAQAVARVILHERVGHEGVNALLESDESFRQNWESLLPQIPEADLTKISLSRGYEGLTRDELALEWLARKAEYRQTQPLVQRLWQAVSKAVKRLLFIQTGSAISIDEQVRQLLDRAQAAVVRGERATLGELRQFSMPGRMNPFTPGDAPGWMRNLLGLPTKAAYRVQNQTLRRLLRGTALPRALQEIVTASQNETKAIEYASAALANDLDKAMQANAARTGRDLQQINDQVSAVMDGTVPLRLLADPELKAAVQRSRNLVDDLSRAVGNATGGNLGQVIMDNLGTWMKRGYAAFDPEANWTYDTVKAAADKGQKIAGVEAKTIWDKALAYLKAEHPQATAGEIEAMMRQLMDRNLWEESLTGGSGGIRKDVSSLMRRKEIAPEIRALMGEERNPVKRLLASTRWQAQFIARHEQQKVMRDLGLKTGLFSSTQDGVFTESLGEDRSTSGFAVNGKKIYTTPELKAALRSAPGAITADELGGGFVKFIYWLGGQAKLNKVALNPDSWLVNLLGNFTGLIQTGGVLSLSTWQRSRKAIELLKAGKPQTASRAAMQAQNDLNRAFMARLTASGVADSSLNAGLVEDALNQKLVQFIQQHDIWNGAVGALKLAGVGQAAGKAFGTAGRVVGGLAGGVAGYLIGNERVQGVQEAIAKWTMQNPDRFGKIVEFLDNYAVGLESGMSDAAAFQLATEKTLDTMPDYTKLPDIIRQASRLGVVGNFVAFQWEVYRNAFHNMRYAVQEIRSGKPALMTKGARRLLGMSAVYGLAAGGLQAMLGNDDAADEDKDQAYRRALGKPWERFSRLAYTKLDEEKASFFNTSYLLPQVTMMEIAQAAAEGKDFSEALSQAADVVQKQFLETGMHVDILMAVLFNRGRDGAQFSTEQGAAMWGERLAEILAPMTPGAADKLERVLRSKEVLNRPRWDREFSVEEEMRRLLGIRQATYQHERRVLGRFAAFNSAKRDISATTKRVFGETGRNKTDAQGRKIQEDAATRANERLAQLQEEYEQFIADLKTLGIPATRIERLRKDAGASRNWTPYRVTDEGIVQPRHQ